MATIIESLFKVLAVLAVGFFIYMICVWLFDWFMILLGKVVVSTHHKYKIKRYKDKSGRYSPVLEIWGFSFDLPAGDILLVKKLLENFFKKDNVMMIITNQEENNVQEPNAVAFASQLNLHKDTLYSFSGRWRVCFCYQDSSCCLETLKSFWYVHQGTTGGTFFFGCAVEDIFEIMSRLAEGVKNIGKSELLEEIVLKNISTKINSVLFSIGADGDCLYINSCGKMLLDEAYRLVANCF